MDEVGEPLSNLLRLGTLVLRTASADRPVPVNLPLLTVDHYTVILRSLFALPNEWKPSLPLTRALRCIEGPPRLLIVFLWAMMQASGSAATIVFGTELDCARAAASLQSFTWVQSAAVLYRCLSALDSGRLVTFIDNIRQGSNLLQLFHSIAALVLLGQEVDLDMLLAPGMTVNAVVFLGFALAEAISGDPTKCRLHWPRIYIWALKKVRVLGFFPPFRLFLLISLV